MLRHGFHPEGPQCGPFLIEPPTLQSTGKQEKRRMSMGPGWALQQFLFLLWEIPASGTVPRRHPNLGCRQKTGTGIPSESVALRGLSVTIQKPTGYFIRMHGVLSMTGNLLCMYGHRHRTTSISSTQVVFPGIELPCLNNRVIVTTWILFQKLQCSFWGRTPDSTIYGEQKKDCYLWVRTGALLSGSAVGLSS